MRDYVNGPNKLCHESRESGGSDKTGFISADKEGNSLWSEKGEGGETVYLFSNQGDLVSKGYIAFQGDMPATGFWTVADKNDHLLVVGYRFRK